MYTLEQPAYPLRGSAEIRLLPCSLPAVGIYYIFDNKAFLHTCCVLPGGHVYSFGELLWRDLSVPVSAPVLEVALLEKTVARVVAGGFHCGALSDQGNVYMWGENTAGQCGVPERGAVTNITGWLTPFSFLISQFYPLFSPSFSFSFLPSVPPFMFRFHLLSTPLFPFYYYDFEE